jgi:hypothetical protein
MAPPWRPWAVTAISVRLTAPLAYPPRAGVRRLRLATVSPGLLECEDENPHSAAQVRARPVRLRYGPHTHAAESPGWQAFWNVTHAPVCGKQSALQSEMPVYGLMFAPGALPVPVAGRVVVLFQARRRQALVAREEGHVGRADAIRVEAVTARDERIVAVVHFVPVPTGIEQLLRGHAELAPVDQRCPVPNWFAMVTPSVPKRVAAFAL